MKTCTNCHISYPNDKKFCKKCGSLLDSNILSNPELIRKNEQSFKKNPKAPIKTSKRLLLKLIILSVSSIIVVIAVLVFTKSLNQKKSWEDAKKINTYDSYQAYLNEYHSDGKHSDEAYKILYALDSIKRLKQDTYRNIVISYYESLSNQNYDANNYFASSVDLFFSMNNTTPVKINNYINESFCKEYLQVKYFIEPKGYIEKKMDKGETKINFIEQMTCFRNSKQKHQLLRTETEVIFNSENKIRFWNSTKVLENSFSSNANNQRATIKCFSGAVGKLKANFNLTWNSNGTISGTYNYPTRPNITYTLKGNDLGNGSIELIEYTGNTVSANCYLNQEGNCYNGKMNNTDGRVLLMTMCE